MSKPSGHFLSQTVIEEFRTLLLNWYDNNPRPLPWKSDRDPYKIWLSEIILQQTQVAQGLPYYLHFIEQYPTVFDLANASLDEVIKSWEGLGYYSRARNLHLTARYIALDNDGQFPRNYKDLLALKGIGPYTAAAIASFAYNQPLAVVDGNVYRVLSRYFNIEEPIDTTSGRKLFQHLANQLIDRDSPGDYNQAIMNFGATICKPKSPKCSVCSLAKNCQAYHHSSINLLPIKSKKIERKNRYFNYLIIFDGLHTFVEKRDDSDIWKSLYQFPLVECDNKNTFISVNKWLPGYQHRIKLEDQSSQLLTHQHIHGNFYSFKLRDSIKVPDQWKKVDISSVKALAFPKMMRTFIEDFF